MGSPALSTSLSSSSVLSCNGKNLSKFSSERLHFASGIPNLRLNPYPNAVSPISGSLKQTRMINPIGTPNSGGGFKTRAYIGEWAETTGGGVSSVQNPTMAQKSVEADVIGLLLKQRIVFLGSNMDDFVADAIISQLLLLDAQDPTKDIRLFINCPGGSISAAMDIFDAVQLCRADVSTVAFGIAASTASIVLTGGSKGKRLAMPNTRIMMHQPLGGASGQAIDVEIQAKEIMYHKTNVTRIISESTGHPFEEVEKDIDRDRYMSPTEAVEYGLIDGIIDRDSIIPLSPLPDRVKPRLDFEDASKDPRMFLTPVIPDDEIYYSHLKYSTGTVQLCPYHCSTFLEFGY